MKKRGKTKEKGFHSFLMLFFVTFFVNFLALEFITPIVRCECLFNYLREILILAFSIISAFVILIITRILYKKNIEFLRKYIIALILSLAVNFILMMVSWRIIQSIG